MTDIKEESITTLNPVPSLEVEELEQAIVQQDGQQIQDQDQQQQQQINDDNMIMINIDQLNNNDDNIIIINNTSSSSSSEQQQSSVINSASNNNNNNVNNISNYNHQCYICDKIFSANSNLNRHLRKIHKENVQSPYNNVRCALCDSVYSSSSIYNQHLENDHKVKIEIEHVSFTNKLDFEGWKLRVENDTTSQFIKSRGEKKAKNIVKTYYSCNRSGYYVSKAKTQKALKKQGSRKINGRCPASMNVTINFETSTYEVRFIKTHVGHDFDLKHLDLSDKDRDLIVEKLNSGATKKDIIKELRSVVDQQLQQSSSSSSSPTTSSGPSVYIPRCSLATTKDIHNIINSKNKKKQIEKFR